MRDGWTSTTLGEIATIVGGGTPSTKNPAYWGGDILWVTPTEITRQEGQVVTRTDRTITQLGLANSSATLVPAGTVLLTSRATIGAVAIAGREMATNQGFAALIPDRSKVVPEFLMYWCQGHRRDFERRAGGNTFKEVSRREVATVPISLPPLGEQRRIADLISSIDRARRAALALREVLARTREQLLRHLISACNPVRRAGWQDVSLGEIMALEYGKALKDVDRDGGDYPVYGSAGIVGWHSKAWVTEAPWIVVGRKGTAGSVHLVRSPGWPIDTTYWVSSKSSSVLVEFLYLLLQAADLPKLCAQTGVPGLNRERVYALKVLLPPLGEQRRIVEVVDAVDRCIAATEAESDAIGGLREQVLSELLQGKHEIPDSYDRFLDQEMA